MPAVAYPPKAPAALLVLAERETPSVAYYFQARAQSPAVGELPVTIVTDDNPVDIPDGCLVVLCRVISTLWLDRLIEHRARLAGVALFLDDDIGACLDDPGLPPEYALRLARQFVRAAPKLAQLIDRVWVSTPALAQRLAAARPIVVPPRALAPGTPLLTVFYHGTAAHRAEFDFLHPVLAALQARRDDLMIELIGDLEVNRRFRDLPRCRILHPMSWPAYAAHTQSVRYAIGLAPLLPSALNEVRAHTKIFDITRCGAAGVYADRAPYSDVITHGTNGLLAGDRVETWVGAIESLASDAAYRQSLADGSRKLVERLAFHTDFPSGAGQDGPAVPVSRVEGEGL
ncbi:hypothetical protein D3874_22870 [Oleomonas cavernae]|uniref:Uncharacterized protein n=1 Tax=Oleomonas cavernae TaxID=2320859 RepID=A0A418WHN9_9PROT|nr:hypothetical protein [Oleomonas cavernae]RJF89462.1 hypothetical protein D3874_22870 [Oleomonas cavernae]